ncbi:CD209 antigen-like protein E [Melanotaenia boesemani]|uniref:CD209 antigen-like protein E n=1 Tax=Melanotaenia boesemani TaxID=1250792 RepID=UPI001C05B316|nr:CD209 antigen-like protein E [Melanotaenia boesemani]XP_041838337.1 CD209 antigen-like protein E [Melanotaenia boesemani]
MARAVHREQTDISMDYVNIPDPSAYRRSNIHNDMYLAAPGTKLYKLVAVSFGFLCILQVALNVSLRLGFYSPDSCNNGTEDLDKLRKLADDYFQQGWVYFHPSLYYISLIKKTWQESREDCLRRGADLVIINTKDEQDFTRQFHKFTWIGLNDSTKKRNWKWVDGTPLTKSYWGPGEPNRFEGKNESCVEIRFHEIENSWNDIPCEDKNFWICEKNVYL